MDYQDYKDAFERVSSNSDLFVKIACLATAEELERFLDSSLNICMILEFEFERRFPKEHLLWVAKTEK